MCLLAVVLTLRICLILVFCILGHQGEAMVAKYMGVTTREVSMTLRDARVATRALPTLATIPVFVSDMNVSASQCAWNSACICSCMLVYNAMPVPTAALPRWVRVTWGELQSVTIYLCVIVYATINPSCSWMAIMYISMGSIGVICVKLKYLGDGCGNVVQVLMQHPEYITNWIKPVYEVDTQLSKKECHPHQN